MKLAAFALDYDGTIAQHGAFDPEIRRAIGDVRRRGLTVLLVTGRRLEDLRRVAGDLGCFDVIVGENGAVLEFPATGRHTALTHPPSPRFLDALRTRGVVFDVGEAIVEADASAAPVILECIRSLELPLTLAFNRGRAMVLPPAVAKSTGLRQALHALRLSPHNTVAIGDAENDHDLLDVCESGAAVEWGSRALREVADDVVRGTPVGAVADYLRRVSRQPRLSAAQMGRRRLALGAEHDGTPVSLAVRGRTIIIAGEPGTGKSWLAGLICEQSILQGYAVCVVDPEGDYRTLDALPGVVVLGGSDPPPGPRELARALRHPDVSTIIDLSKLSHDAKVQYVGTLMPMLAALRRRSGLPHKILLDEAHYFLRDVQHTRVIDPELAGYIVVTYRLSSLDPAVRATGDVVALVTRERDPEEVDALLAMCRPAPERETSRAILAELTTNEAALLPGAEESRGGIRRFAVGRRLTAHVRHRAKYVDMPVGETAAFVFDARTPHLRARSLNEFVARLNELPDGMLKGHVERHDFSRWIHDVFRDRPLAAHVSLLEGRIAVDDTRIVTDAIAQAIRARYEMGGPQALAGAA